MVDVYEKGGGFHFAINDAGDTLCTSLTSDYAKEYKQIAIKTLAHVGGKTEREVISEINRLSTAALRQGGYDG
jgi:hypothetical protein